jgi:hypothetical protein
VGIDRSTPYRGIAVVAPAVADRARGHEDIAVYEPASAAYKPK